MAEREFDTLTTQRGSLAKLAEAIATKQSAFLTVTEGENMGRRMKLADVPVTLGRSADCDFRLLSRAISRMHCRVWRDNTGYWVRDLNSTNKTYLNDRPVVEARLKDGDFISVGGTVVQFTQEQDVDRAAQGEFVDLMTQDQLTGLPQRRVFEQSVEQEIARSVKRGREFVVAIVDVDDMPRINREWGKAAGDDVLRQVGRALKAGLRDEDVCCRYSGAEFAAMLPETGIEEAEKILNAIRSAVANVEFFVQGQSRRASTSIALLLWKPEYRSVAITLEKAEQKLKGPQDFGRNRLIV